MLADLVDRHELDLWPELTYGGRTVHCPEIRSSYPHRGAVPREVWHRFFGGAEREIGILVYSGLFLAEDVDVLRAPRPARRAPASAYASCSAIRGPRRSAAAAPRRASTTRCRPRSATRSSTTARCGPDGVEIRLHATVLYNSIYRADDELLVNTHIHGVPAAQAPVLHLDVTGELTATYTESFERVWSLATPLDG